MTHEGLAAVTASRPGSLVFSRGGAEVARSRGAVTRSEAAWNADVLDVDSDQALIARVRDGDRSAFEVLVSRYQDRVYTIVHGLVRDPDDAMDLVQETFLKAYQGLHTFRGKSSFYTWLYRIAVNNCKDFVRKRSARPSVSLEDEQLQDLGFEPPADPKQNPAEAAQTREMRRMVREAVETLPEKLRMAIILHDIQGLPQQDVAAILKCPLGTVKSHVFRGRARLRKLLGRYVEGED
ncbi:MAG: sigma-70 family RNA polymerase sigma factor [Armatimonadota bacterium]|nr:sigma-70 family RNA polymerase sigma factor [Armatimonadota bacterium]